MYLIHCTIGSAPCDCPLQPFAAMRSKFFDGIEGGKPTNRLENKIFTIDLDNNIKVVMTKWKVHMHQLLGPQVFS